jgi:hypothetical protein
MSFIHTDATQSHEMRLDNKMHCIYKYQYMPNPANLRFARTYGSPACKNQRTTSGVLRAAEKD